MSDSDLTIDKKITVALEKLSGAINYITRDAAESKGLSPIQLQFLDFLDRYPDELRTVSSLAREFNLTKGTVSEAVKTLEAKGLVKKHAGEGDGRIQIIKPTGKGASAAFESIRVRDMLAETISTINVKSKEDIYSFLVDLIASLASSEILPFARICINCENRYMKSDGSFACRLTGNAVGGRSVDLSCHSFTQESF